MLSKMPRIQCIAPEQAPGFANSGLGTPVMPPVLYTLTCPTYLRGIIRLLQPFLCESGSDIPLNGDSVSKGLKTALYTMQLFKEHSYKGSE